MDLLERALADLAEHPDSSAREIAKRIGANDRDVFCVLDNAAYDGKCQRWRGDSSGPWRWELPGCTACLDEDETAVSGTTRQGV